VRKSIATVSLPGKLTDKLCGHTVAGDLQRESAGHAPLAAARAAMRSLRLVEERARRPELTRAS
jgi:hypothetical protein